MDKLASDVAEPGVNLEATSSQRLSPVEMPFITERPKDSSESTLLATLASPPSLIWERTTSALPSGVHALSLHAAVRSDARTTATPRIERSASTQPPRSSSLPTRFAHARGVTRHPDRDRLSLPIGVVAAERRADDLDGRVRRSERIDHQAVCAD